MTKEGVGRTGGQTGGNAGSKVGNGGAERALIIFPPLYLYFVDMSSHVDIVNPTCPKWGNVITHKI